MFSFSNRDDCGRFYYVPRFHLKSRSPLSTLLLCPQVYIQVWTCIILIVRGLSRSLGVFFSNVFVFYRTKMHNSYGLTCYIAVH